MAALLLATVAEAQVARPYKTLYLGVQAGAATYIGDADGAPDNSFSDLAGEASFMAGGEIGYQFTPSLGFGVGVYYNQLPGLKNASGGQDESKIIIEPAFRYNVFPRAKVTPFIVLGAGMTTYEDYAQNPAPRDVTDQGLAIGPNLGLGIDALLGNKLSLYALAKSTFFFPDGAFDDTDPLSGSNNAAFDNVSGISAGLRYFFKAAIIPVEATIDCVTTLEVGQPGTFTAFVNDNASGPLSYSWNWGDGSSSDGLVATHSYSAAGTYTVTFTATGPSNSDTETCLVTVNEPPAEPVVLANCVASPQTVGVGETVSFSSTATGTAPISYSWDFGDGQTASTSTANTTHTFSQPGTYTVTLTATNEAGSDTCTFTVVVVDTFCDEVTELNTVYFDYKSATLTEEAMSRLDENLEVLRRCMDICVTINAYTDDREPNKMRLSQQRADAVMAYYVQNGISEDRLRARGLGEAPDANSKEDPDIGDRNARRAESIPMPCSEFMDDMDMDGDMDMDDDGM